MPNGPMDQNHLLRPRSRLSHLSAALLVIAGFGSGGALIMTGFILAALSWVGLR